MEKKQVHLSRLFTGSLRSLYFLLGIAAILFWTYLFGHPILEGNIKGSDSGYALAVITWIDRWFPTLPAWYPLQGAGASSIVQYPYGAHYLVVLVSRVSGLTLTQVFRVTQLASVAATASGIYLLAWRKLKSQTTALIAGLFYPISSAAWHWLAGIGLFAQSVSLAFFVPVFLLFDAYLLRGIDNQTRSSVARRRMLLIAVTIGLCLMMVTHVITAAVFVMTIALYSLLVIVTQRKVFRVSALGMYGRRFFTVIATGFALAAFWLIPYLHITSIVNREGPSHETSLYQIQVLDLPAAAGLREHPPTRSLYSVTFASPVLILAIVGLALSVTRHRFVLSLTIISVAFALFTALPGICPGIVKPFQRVWANLYGRAILATMVFLPIVAGYGAMESAHLLANLPTIFSKGRQTGVYRSTLVRNAWPILRSGLAGLLGIAIAVGAFIYLRHVPLGSGDYQGYGFPRSDVWWPFDFGNGGVEVNHWPNFMINSDDWPNAGRTASQLTEILSLDASKRLDVSPYFGGMLEVLPLYSDTSTVGMYYYQGGLNSSMRGYMAATYWNSEYGSRHEVDEFAKWLGIDYVLFNIDLDPLEKYDGGNWVSLTLPDDKGLTNIAVRGFNDPTGIASVLAKPEVLVIGGFENKAYEQIFRLFNSGLVEYDQAIIVEGSHQIDDYSKEELSQFELVFLHGYGYRNRDCVWDLLAEYVQAGGALYVDTGWQYMVPDWEMDEAPALLPVGNLEWTSVNSSEQLFVSPDADWTSIEAEQFAPMMWGDQPWGVSSPKNGLRDWATSVLIASNKPLVAAGQYGEGRIVWSGMNLVGHINRYQDSEERTFLQDLITWLLPGTGTDQSEKPEIRRDHPDSVSLTIPGPVSEGTNLLWRENHTPDWHAMVEVNGVEEELEIYRAGPGMMIMHLPSSHEEVMVVKLEYSIASVRGIGVALTALTGNLLLGFVAGKIDLSRSDTNYIAAMYEKDPKHHLEASSRDAIIHTGRSNMWKKLFKWLPRPFLDEKTHRDAHKKPLREKDILPASYQDDLAGGGETFDPTSFKARLNDEEEALMKSWLENKDNEEDPWVNKILDPDQRK